MKIWKYISIFLGGMITGFLVLTKLKKPETVINADTYVDEQHQKIGKVKQKNTDGSSQSVELSQETPSRKEIRKAKKQAKKEKRKNGK